MHEGMTLGGRYRLIKCLVSSRATEVWLASDLSLGREVVLKRLLGDSAEASRLLAEARALAAFNHPNVVTLYHTLDDWLVMEHVSGGSLDDRLGMSPEKAADVGAKIADALAALHDKGIVHLDVKPANIVDAGNGVVKLADFGAAYRVGGRDTITVNGAISYTVPYAAPEVLLGQPCPRSDVFSLGATVYALVAGRPPRAEADDGETDTDLVAWEAAHSPVSLTADVGPLDGLLREMLEQDPRQRPSVREARKRLAEIAGAPLPDEDAHDGVLRRVMARLRSRWALLMTGVVAVILAAVAVPIWGGPPVEGPPVTPPLQSSPATASASAGAAHLVIGDPRTADPCAMIDPAALDRFGRTELDTDYGNYDRCDVRVFLPDGGVVDVMADLNQDAPPENAATARTVGGIAVIDGPAESEECSRTLVLPGVKDVTVRVRAQWEDDPGKADLCEIADEAATIAARALDRGPLKRRSPPLAANSLARQDACALLSGRALEAVPGIDATDPDIGFAGWDCEWDSTTSDTGVDLGFDRDQPLTAEAGTVTRINGYRTFVEPGKDGDRSCTLEVEYRRYVDQNGRTAVEIVRIVVRGSRPMNRLCAMATALARSATAELRDT